jgi:hypothetical protein
MSSFTEPASPRAPENILEDCSVPLYTNWINGISSDEEVESNPAMREGIYLGLLGVEDECKQDKHKRGSTLTIAEALQHRPAAS